nr:MULTISPECIES: hypothetical protein [unclassified Bradyrhizobium]
MIGIDLSIRSFGQELTFGFVPEIVHFSEGLARVFPEHVRTRPDILLAQARHATYSLLLSYKSAF